MLFVQRGLIPKMRIFQTIGFMKSMTSLSSREQKDAIKAFDLMLADPNHPSLRIHPVKESKYNFYTIRMSQGGRIVAFLNNAIAVIYSFAEVSSSFPTNSSKVAVALEDVFKERSSIS